MLITTFQTGTAHALKIINESQILFTLKIADKFTHIFGYKKTRLKKISPTIHTDTAPQDTPTLLFIFLFHYYQFSYQQVMLFACWGWPIVLINNCVAPVLQKFQNVE